MTLQTRRVRALGLIEKVILGIIAGAAAAIGVVEVVLTVGRVIGTLTDRVVTVAGIALAETAAPVFTEASARVVTADYDSVTLAIEGLPTNIRALLVAAFVLGTLVTIGVCAAVAWLCLRVFLGRPFVTSATWAIGLVAILIIAGQLGSALLTSIANAEIASYLGAAGDQLPVFLAEVTLAPLGWGLALAVVAAAFEIGQRLQRETEGLV
jgi:hypothetical protein